MTTQRPQPRTDDDPSILLGAVAGLIGGLAASFVMDRFQAAVTPVSSPAGAGEPATDKAAGRVTKAVTGHGLAKAYRPLGGHVVHYTLGAGLGALYGVAAEYRRDVTAGKGAAFGLGVAVVLDNAVVPAVGLGDPPWRTDASTHAYSGASHLVFGLVAELVRNAVRRSVPVAGSMSDRRTPLIPAASRKPG